MIKIASKRLPGLSALALAFWTSFAPASQRSTNSQTTVILVIGAAGETEFGTNFMHQAGLWDQVCQKAGCGEIKLGLDSATNDCERLKQILAAEPKEGPNELWLILIGHGTFDGKEARFN